MKTGTYWIVGILLLLLAGGGYFLYSKGYFGTANLTGAEEQSSVCTMDVKLCPDGSYVSRVAPSCAFATCPSATTQSTTPRGPVQIEAGLDESVSALGVTITPLTVLEDSRCPVNVQCIQAGTVRLSAKITSAAGDSTETLTLGKPLTTETETITLTSVLPVRMSGTTLVPSSYRFAFTIEKRITPAFDVKG